MAGHAAALRPACVAFSIALACAVVGIFVWWAFWASIVAFVLGLTWVVVAASRAAGGSRP